MQLLGRITSNRSLVSIANTAGAMTASRLLTLVMSVFIARTVGAEQFGTFAFATGTALLIGQLGSLGWPTLLTREIPRYVSSGDWARLRGLNFAADSITAISMLLCAAGCLGIAIFALDEANPLYFGLIFTAALVLPTGLRLLNRQRLAAIGRPAAGIFFDESLAPIIVLGALFIVSIASPMAVFATYVVGTVFSAFGARYLYRRWANRAEFSVARTIEFKAWMAVALPLMTAVASRVMLNRIDAVMIAPLSSVYEAGLYNTAFRIAFLATLVPAMSTTVIRPMLAAAHHEKRYGFIRDLMKYYYLATIGISGAISLVMFLFAPLILRYTFGSEFEPAAGLLQILAIGSLFGSISESASSYLMMCGKEKNYGVTSVAGLVLAIGLNVWLIPQFGGFGAALTNVVVNFVLLALTVFFVARDMRQHRDAS